MQEKEPSEGEPVHPSSSPEKPAKRKRNTLRVYQDVQKACTNRGNTLGVYQDVQKTCTNRGKHELTPFGAVVKKALVEKKKTQVDLAKSIGVSKQYLYLVLHGIRPGTKYINRIAEYCDLDPEVVEKTIKKEELQRKEDKR